MPSGFFSSGFSAKVLYAFCISPVQTTCHSHLVDFNHLNI
jgi:hypothetical protein